MSSPLSRRDVLPLIRQALAEDAARHDVTSRAVLSASLRIRARMVAQSPGMLAGAHLAAWVFEAADHSLRCVLKRRDGARLARGETIMVVEGRARSIFAAERVALNLAAHLSGVATLTRAFVDRIQGTRARIYDTRKTLPGLRLLEKYAVRVGGGYNHRSSLADAILIKTNHVRAGAAGRGLRHMVQVMDRLRHRHPKQFIEVEVVDLPDLLAARIADPDAILLDNWTVRNIRRGVHLAKVRLRGHPAPLLEVSGGVTLANVRAMARTGVDRISVGRLTHSAPSLDVSLQVI